MTVLEYIQQISSLIFETKAKLSKDEEELDQIALAYLVSMDPRLLEQVETQKNIVIRGYQLISACYEDQSIKYLELASLEDDSFDKQNIIKLAGERMRLAEEATAKAKKVADSHKF